MAEKTEYKVEQAHKRLDQHETIHEQFDRRITLNENYRLQAVGALKTITLLLGAGGLGFVIDAFFNIF